MNGPTAHEPEEWRRVVGFPDYQVSSHGSVVSRKDGGVRELSATPNKAGYRQVKLSRDRTQVSRYVHGLVAETFHGARPVGTEVCHLDGDRSNNRVTNLAYGTTAENAQDRLRHGTDQNARKTHCKRGHEFTPANTKVEKSGSRRCRACTSTAARELSSLGGAA